jgi:hypothetical protein
MAEVVKSALRKPSSFQVAMEVLTDSGRVNWPAGCRCEHQACFSPTGAGGRPFLELQIAMVTQRPYDRCRKRQGPPASCRLWLNQLRMAIESLELF